MSNYTLDSGPSWALSQGLSETTWKEPVSISLSLLDHDIQKIFSFALINVNFDWGCFWIFIDRLIFLACPCQKSTPPCLKVAYIDAAGAQNKKVSKGPS